MEVQDYTEKSIVVIGETKDNKDGLIKLGGKFNAKLKVGPGWIFPKTEKERVLKFVNDGIITEKKTTYKIKEESNQPKEEVISTTKKEFLKPDLLTQINQKIDRILKEVEELKKLLTQYSVKSKEEKVIEEEEYEFVEEVKQPLKKLF